VISENNSSDALQAVCFAHDIRRAVASASEIAGLIIGRCDVIAVIGYATGLDDFN
jgi:hypothetical protein